METLEPSTRPTVLVARFFELVIESKLVEADRILDKIREKMRKTEWNRGYYRSLYGMLLVHTHTSTRPSRKRKGKRNQKRVVTIPTTTEEEEHRSDQYSYFYKITQKKEGSYVFTLDQLKNERSEFQKFAKNNLHVDFDKGVATAWSDCLRVMIILRSEKKV